MKLGLIVAMDKEFELISKILKNSNIKIINRITFAQGTYEGKDIVLTKCGIGKVNAALGTLELIKNFAPQAIINTGIAGGLDKNSKIMDMVAGDNVVYHDVWCGEGNEYGQVQGLPPYFESDEKLLKLATGLKTDINIYAGQICSGDQFITNKEELAKIKAKFPEAQAVDMESCPVAQVCYLYHIPYVALRIISDTPGVENHSEQYAGFWNKAPEKSLEVLKALIAKL